MSQCHSLCGGLRMDHSPLPSHYILYSDYVQGILQVQFNNLGGIDLVLKNIVMYVRY